MKQRGKGGKSIFETAQDVEAAFEGNETQMLHQKLVVGTGIRWEFRPSLHLMVGVDPVILFVCLPPIRFYNSGKALMIGDY